MFGPAQRATRPVLRAIGAAACAFLLLPSAGAGVAAPDELARRVEQVAAQAARDHVLAPDHFEVLSSRFGGAPPVDPTSVRLELARVEGPNAAGVLRVSLRMLVGGLPKGEARATVRGRVLGPALTAARTLTRGAVLRSSDVEVKDTDLTRIIGEPLRDPGQVLGRVPVRTLGKGRVLTDELVGPAPVVRRGQLVDLRIERDHMTVRAQGRALGTGAPGEIVPAENNVTGVKVEGIAQPDGSLLVLRPGNGRS